MVFGKLTKQVEEISSITQFSCANVCGKNIEGRTHQILRRARMRPSLNSPILLRCSELLWEKKLKRGRISTRALSQRRETG